jgi:hypothetical protein
LKATVTAALAGSELLILHRTLQKKLLLPRSWTEKYRGMKVFFHALKIFVIYDKHLKISIHPRYEVVDIKLVRVIL